MKITVETSVYNPRRYGKPWIALIDFSSSTKGEFSWGDWTGDARNGGAGILSITTNAGDIVARGQKDNRNSSNSAPDFYVVSKLGKLESIGDKGAAYKFFLGRKNDIINKDELNKEREALILRIAEIDSIIAQK